MKITERHLAHLAAVVDTGSVTQGAARVGLTQPALSRTIAALEKRLGQPLFVPGRRPLQPTALGRELAVQGRVILHAAQTASDSVDTFFRGTAGTVRLGGVPFFMDALVSRMIAEFRDHAPGVRVDQTYGFLPTLQAALRADLLDFAVAPVGQLPRDTGLSFDQILPARNVVACRSGHPLLRTRTMQAVDMFDFPWIAPAPGSPLRADLMAILAELGLRDVSFAYSGASLAGTLAYLGATDALCVLPQSVVFACARQHRVAMLPIDIPQSSRALGILRNRAAAPPPAADRLAAHIKAGCADLRAAIVRHESGAPRPG